MAHCGVCFDRLGEHHLYRMSLLFSRAEKRLMNAYHSFPLLCFISTFSLCTSPAQIQTSSSCTAFTRFQGAVSPWRSHKASSFRSATVFRLFLVISHHHNQLLGILLAKAALSHPSQSHLAPSLILLAVVFSSACNVLIIDNVSFTPPFTRIGTDGTRRFTAVTQQP